MRTKSRVDRHCCRGSPVVAIAALPIHSALARQWFHPGAPKHPQMRDPSPWLQLPLALLLLLQGERVRYPAVTEGFSRCRASLAAPKAGQRGAGPAQYPLTVHRRPSMELRMAPYLLCLLNVFLLLASAGFNGANALLIFFLRFTANLLADVRALGAAAVLITAIAAVCRGKRKHVSRGFTLAMQGLLSL